MKDVVLAVLRPIRMCLNLCVGRRKRRRYALDQAATIFPATVSRNQHHIFNFSAELTQPVDKDTLQQALENACRRFPTIAASLHAGPCWYHLEPLAHAPRIRDGLTCRLQPIYGRELRQSCLRVALEDATISVDFFHALTDGSGALVFMRSLLAEYIRLRYGESIEAKDGVFSCADAPREAESEDSYARYAKGAEIPAKPVRAYKHYSASDGRLRYTLLKMDAAQVLKKARGEGATVTQYLAALMLQAVERTKAGDPSARRDRPVRLGIPVDLRNHFPSKTLRNFSLCCTIDSAPGRKLSELCAHVRQQLAAQNTAENMAGMTLANEKLIRIARYALPLLAMKNAAMKIGYRLKGSNLCTTSLSNLGRVAMPAALCAHVRDIACRADANAYDTHCCTVMTYQQTLSIRFGRSVRDAILEDHFSDLLQDEGIAFTRENE